MDEELKCKVCLGDYDERELKPRILPCLHVVCDSCLQVNLPDLHPLQREGYLCPLKVDFVVLPVKKEDQMYLKCTYCAQNYLRWQHSCSVHSFPTKIGCCHDITFSRLATLFAIPFSILWLWYWLFEDDIRGFQIECGSFSLCLFNLLVTCKSGEPVVKCAVKFSDLVMLAP